MGSMARVFPCSLSTRTAYFLIVLIAKIVPWSCGIIGVSDSVSNVPRFEIEKVPSVISSGFNLFFRVFSTRPFAALEIPTRFKRWAFFI
jgi:hypothetical protein